MATLASSKICATSDADSPHRTQPSRVDSSPNLKLSPDLREIMPPSKRRRISGPATTSKTTQQSTLSFRSTKVGAKDLADKTRKPTKATYAPTSESDALQNDTESTSARISTPAADVLDNGESAPAAPREEITLQIADEKEEEDELKTTALAIPESKIKSYWAAKERERRAPRVHQQDLTVREKILREFDMSSRYGPSIGITRYSRWRRAHNLGMAPPIEVLAVLLKESNISESKKNTQSTEKSIIDELIISSRARGEATVES